MQKEQALGIVRHLLGAAGAYVVATGSVEPGIVNELTGALMTLAAVVWSLIAKVQPIDPKG